MRGVLLTVFLLASFRFSSCSPSQHSIARQGFLVGTVNRIGNEPFTKLGLLTSDGTVYTLNCSKEIESELMTNQGNILKVYYIGSIQTSEGLILRVVKIEFPLNK